MAFVLIFYAVVVTALTWTEYNSKQNQQIWLKPLAAIIFILIAIFGGALYWDYGRWILWALVACAIGDVLLLSRNSQIKFQLGMLAFAIGHLLYVVAFVKLSGQWGLTPLAVLPLIAAGLFYFWLRPKLQKDMVIPVTTYTGIIILMLITSLGVSDIRVPLAAIMFAVSDMFVARDRFVKNEGINALAITPLYFGAQALFALSAGIGS